MLNSIGLLLWLAALYGHLILFISLLASRKTALMRDFTALTGLFFLWTFCSVCIRLSVKPNHMFWFRNTITFLTMIPFTLFLATKRLCGEKFRFTETLLIWLATITQMMPNFFDMYFRPVFIMDSFNMETLEGAHRMTNIRFNPTPWIILMIIMSTAIFVHCFMIMRKNDDRSTAKQFMAGIFAFWAGNILLLIPGEKSMTPDLIGTVINCIMLVNIIYRKNLFRLKLFISHSTLAFFSAMSVLTSSVVFFSREWGLLNRYKEPLFLMLVITALSTSLVTAVYCWLSDRYFFSRGDYMMKVNTDYHDRLLRSVGQRDRIIKETAETMKRLYGSVNLIIYLREKPNEKFHQVCGQSFLDLPDIDASSGLADYMLTLEGPSEASEAKDLIDDEQFGRLHDAIADRDIRCIVPMMDSHMLSGFMLVGGERLNHLGSSEFGILSSIASTTYMALRTTCIINKLEHDASEDQLTRLYNRYTVMNLIEDSINRNEDFMFVVMNIDDLKLFNHVFSLAAGDRLLQIFGESMKENCTGGTYAARISGKTFGAVLYDCTREEAIAFDSAVRETFRRKNKGTPREGMTFSSGLLDVRGDDGIKDPNILFDMVRKAVMIAKKNGRNRLVEYDASMEINPSLHESGFKVKTAEALSKALDLRDHFTYNHSNNVARYARDLASAAGQNPLEQQIIYEAGLIHDIGKISIPDNVLLKKGRLTDEEYEIMKTHVERSRDVIVTVPHGFLMLPIALAHHERWDGKGYPKKLKGEEIPVGGRCLAIADCFDAMISKRVYKDPMSVEQALCEIERNAGTQFDPELALLFAGLVRDGDIIPTPDKTF